MGRFSCLVVVLVAACADTPVDVPDGTDGINLPDGVDTVGATPRLLPSVCGANEWTAKVTDVKVDLSVAGRPQGAALVSTPILGGDSRGIIVDTRMRIVQDQSLATSYDAVSMTYAGNRFVRTGASSGAIDIHMMADDLRSSDLVTTVAGDVVAKPAFVQLDQGFVMPVGSADGLSLYRFQDSFEPLDSRLVAATSSPVTGVTAAHSGSTTLVAWSTKSECNMMEVNGLESAGQAKLLACPNPRLAVDSASLNGMLAFDSPDGVTVSFTRGAIITSRDVVRAGSHSPRTLFDGKNFWISWLNERGDVIVGVVDANHQIRTIGLNLTRPFDSGYELAMVEGSPWVFAVDANGYSGHRLCTVTQ